MQTRSLSSSDNYLKHIRKGCALILGFFPPTLGTQVRQGGVQFRLRYIGLVQQNVQLLLCCLASLLPVRRQGHVCMDMQSHETYKIGKASKIILASALFWT